MAALLRYALNLLTPLLGRLFKSKEQQTIDEISPYVCHRVLNIVRGKNLLIVGDVHGCYDETMALLEIAQQRSSHPVEVIFVGDVVNKGPKSLEMLEFVRNAGNVHCIRGNHEQNVLCQYLRMKNSRDVTHDHWIANITNAQFEYMRNLPYTITIPSIGCVVVHAGLVPGIPLHQQSTNNMLNMRNLVVDINDFYDEELCGTSDNRRGTCWAESWIGPQHVYFGHDALRKLQTHPHCTGLDTGCVYGGKLTAVLLKLNNFGENHDNIEREFISVDPFKVYKKVG
uniref:uncharacterized protein LOC101243356 n=1 Tax=Ciona intestinalis TaxID=7719 RepID=UPI0002B8ED10|nr:uncharacterized protein LOC101243356 [Ciona intestinalis]|eukprot:XP_004227501.1 uncharacterized protein LOC101243356 [Ciona intestinalis]